MAISKIRLAKQKLSKVLAAALPRSSSDCAYDAGLDEPGPDCPMEATSDTNVSSLENDHVRIKTLRIQRVSVSDALNSCPVNRLLQRHSPVTSIDAKECTADVATWLQPHNEHVYLSSSPGSNGSSMEQCPR